MNNNNIDIFHLIIKNDYNNNMVLFHVIIKINIKKILTNII